MKILVIEDDSDISELLKYNFELEKWPCDVSGTGEKGIKIAKTSPPDLIILDLNLPDQSGLEVCRKFKSDPATQNIPIVMLTAKSEEIDRVVGFEIGAEDYVTKPFSPREFILRLKVIEKRFSQKKEKSENPPSVITFGILRYDSEKYEVQVEGKFSQLTSMEFKLLGYLLKCKGRVATRDTLLDKIWGYAADLTTRTVDTHIKRLREKLGPAGIYIETIRGVGYRFKEMP